MGRPRKYVMPEFEEWLLDTGRTNRTMARIYVQQVAKVTAILGNDDPSEDEVRQAVQTVGAHEHHTRAAWNAYAESMKATKSVVLPTLSSMPKVPRLTQWQAGMTAPVDEFARHAEATLRELMLVDAASVQLYRADPARLGVEVLMTSPARMVRTYVLRETQCFMSGRCAWAHIEAAWDRAYEARRRDLRVFNIGPPDRTSTWDEWCSFASSAGLRTRSDSSPTWAEPVPVDLPGSTDRDRAFWAWCQDPSQSWETMQERAYGFTAQEKQDAALAQEVRANVDRIVDGRD